MDLLAQGKRGTGRFHNAQVLPRAALRCLSLSNAMLSAEVGRPWADGETPDFPALQPPLLSRFPGTPFHPSLLQEGCADFHQKILSTRDH